MVELEFYHIMVPPGKVAAKIKLHPVTKITHEAEILEYLLGETSGWFQSGKF